MIPRISDACTLALTLPLAVAVLWVASVVALERAGATPFAGIVPRNSAEAAGLGMASEMLRFLSHGEDPYRVYDVRPEILSSAILRATTVEAAMWARQVELIQLLDREGAIAGLEDRKALRCLAADLQLDDVVEYLGAEAGASCEPGNALERVAARTRQHAAEERRH